ncbi:hypothetical protein [Sphingosinicella soli]|uniref:DUF4864 domain-containing protein n=1 Tax=Sphingosinicella soli TaxID=333708 RepID=A0A7W7B4M0_9SPHN|nr:hypothetical protein [Sphingosinicella soli]MBB4633854.1 hypothetical protein [Sphingosinicella soli]
MRSALTVMMACLIASFAVPGTASAQTGRAAIVKGLHQSDIETVQPLIREMLDNDEVGSTREWRSPSGNQGELRLVKGGKLADMDTGRVRITVIAKERRIKTFTFRYERDAGGEWRTAG